MFPTLSTDDTVSLFTKDLDICNGQLVEVYHESWEMVVANLKEVVVVVTRSADIQDGVADNAPASSASSGERFCGLVFVFLVDVPFFSKYRAHCPESD